MLFVFKSIFFLFQILVSYEGLQVYDFHILFK